METYLFSLFHRAIVKQERSYYKLIGELSATKSGLQNQVLVNQKLVEGIVESLINALEAKDPCTQGHSQRVSWMAAGVAKSMGLLPLECEQVRLAGLFHDIGKIGIRDSILLKKGPLTKEEFQEIKLHPIYSVKILEPVDPFHKVLSGVLYHHENWDGSGYPEGLKGNKIPLAASIIHVVDSYDALTSMRSYRLPMSSGAAISELEQKSGVYYQPEVVSHFSKWMETVREKAVPMLSSPSTDKPRKRVVRL